LHNGFERCDAALAGLKVKQGVGKSSRSQGDLTDVSAGA
jgi:hypothetical protein